MANLIGQAPAMLDLGVDIPEGGEEVERLGQRILIVNDGAEFATVRIA
jgi:hypothetical protein